MTMPGTRIVVNDVEVIAVESWSCIRCEFENSQMNCKGTDCSSDGFRGHLPSSGSSLSITSLTA